MWRAKSASCLCADNVFSQSRGQCLFVAPHRVLNLWLKPLRLQATKKDVLHFTSVNVTNGGGTVARILAG